MHRPQHPQLQQLLQQLKTRNLPSQAGLAVEVAV
jgi:hypothetical protein